MEDEDNIIVKWAQEDVETSYNLLKKIIFRTDEARIRLILTSLCGFPPAKV